METSNLDSVSAQCLAVGLCIPFYLVLQEVHLVLCFFLTEASERLMLDCSNVISNVRELFISFSTGYAFMTYLL